MSIEFGSANVVDDPAAVLDGVLRTLILPIDVDVTDVTAQAPPPHPDSHLELFAPGQRWAMGRFDESGGRPSKWVDRAVPGDIGLGLPRLLASRVFPVEGGAVRFGASARSLDDAPLEIDERTWLLTPAVCVSLWATASLPVLTIERLEPRRSDEHLIALCRDERLARDVATAAEDLLDGTPLSPAFTLQDVFRPPRRSRFRRDVREGWNVPVASLRVAATRHVRGVPITECLLTLTAPCATGIVEMVLARPDGSAADAAERRQKSGAVHNWEPLELAGSPAETKAKSAVRGDARYALLNLEAMSINHEYRDLGSGGALAAAIPVVALRAATARAFRTLADEFARAADGQRLRERIEAVEELKLTLLRRRMLRRFIGVEEFRRWTTPGALASELYTRVAPELDELADDSVQAAEIVQSSLDRVREERQRRNERLIQGLSPAAGVVALASMFAALASVPDPAEPSLLAALPDALVVTIGLVAAAAVLGLGYFFGKR